jgi:putative alpha-1,2-mannosidase
MPMASSRQHCVVFVWSRRAKTLLAGHATNAWGAGRRDVYCAGVFASLRSRGVLSGRQAGGDGSGLKGKNLKAVVHYKTHAGEQILIKAGLSGVSTEGAARNLAAEIPGWDFAGCSMIAEERWRAELGKIRVETASDNDKRVFYSAFYHTMLGSCAL